MCRLEQYRSVLFALSWVALLNQTARAQQAESTLGVGGRQSQVVRMSLDDSEPETASMSLVDAGLEFERARMSLDDGQLNRQTVRLSLDDDLGITEVEDSTAKMSLSDDEVSVVSSLFQEPTEDFADELFFSETPGATHWLTAGYLMMWTKGSRAPELLTTSAPGTPRANAGVLGLSSTSVLFGNQDIDNGFRNGLRASFGRWLDCDHDTAVEVDYFSAFDDASSGDYYAASTGTPILARPFYNAALFTQDAELVAFPNVVEGAIGISNTSESHSFAVLLRRNHLNCPGGRVDVVSGYRQFRYRDGIRIQDHLVSTEPAGPFVIGTTFDAYDHFRAENEFQGGEFGIHSQIHRGIVTYSLLAKIAIGRLKRDMLVDGRTTVTVPGVFPLTTVSEGGLLALPTNMGRHSSKTFAALPELGLSATVAVTDRVSVQAGYTLLWLNDVARSAEMIDSRVNPTQRRGSSLIGNPYPARLQSESDFWMQGLNLMIMFEG